jgi:hypothetical protein
VGSKSLSNFTTASQGLKPSGSTGLEPTTSGGRPSFLILDGRSLFDNANESLSIRMVAGYREATERKNLLVAEARYVLNTQFLTIPFRSELVYSAA